MQPSSTSWSSKDQMQEIHPHYHQMPPKHELSWRFEQSQWTKCSKEESELAVKDLYNSFESTVTQNLLTKELDTSNNQNINNPREKDFELWTNQRDSHTAAEWSLFKRYALIYFHQIHRFTQIKNAAEMLGKGLVMNVHDIPHLGFCLSKPSPS